MAHDRQPTVLVDMDQVLADFDGTLEAKLRMTRPDLVLLDPALHYFTSKRTTDQEVIDHIHEIKNGRGFFRELPVIDGAVQGWQQIEELGYHPRVCTSPLTTNLWCVTEKLEWIDAYLGPEAADDAILDEEKWKYPGICLIDDRPEVEGHDRADWTHAVFTQPYNRSIDTIFRIDGWYDPNIPGVLARCAARAIAYSAIRY